MTPLNELRAISDRLSEIEADVQTEDSRPDSASAQLRRARYMLEDAISELMHSAAKQYGGTIQPGSIERRAA